MRLNNQRPGSRSIRENLGNEEKVVCNLMGFSAVYILKIESREEESCNNRTSCKSHETVHLCPIGIGAREEIAIAILSDSKRTDH